MTTGPEELDLETIDPGNADLVDLRYEGVDLPLDQNADPTQVELACGEHLGVVDLDGDYENEGFIDFHLLGDVARGESAYGTAVRNGFVGTEEQWLESLVGPESPNAAQAYASEQAAEAAATRSETAASGAETSETVAGQHASAAEAFRDEAEVFRNEAGIISQQTYDYLTDAGVAAGEALVYRDQSAQNLIDANSAALRAETAEGVSTSMRDQARGFSEASASSSQTAEGYMDESRTEAQAARDAHLLAETSRENSLAHSLASYDAAQEAIARSTEAGEYATAALTSRLAAEAARDDANQTALAIITDRDIVIARADEAGEYAEAAEQHRVEALTSAGAAQVSAENSAISETNAGNSATASAASSVSAYSSYQAAQDIADYLAGINPTLNYLGEFDHEPTQAELGAEWKQNAFYKNSVNGYSYVLTGTPLEWERYLADGTLYQLTVESNNGTIFRVGQATYTTLIGRLFKNGAEITDVTPSGYFSWRRVSADPVADATWNALYTAGYKQVTISVDDVSSRASFFCDITSPV
jgi:hypothetical protein